MALQDSFALPNVCFILYVAPFLWFQFLVVCYSLVAFDAGGKLCLLLDTRLNLGHGLRVDFHVGRSISIMFSLIVSVDSLCFLSSSFLWDDLTELSLVEYCYSLYIDVQYPAAVDCIY